MPQAEEALSPFQNRYHTQSGPLFKFLSAGTVHATVGAKANRALLTPTKPGIELLNNSILCEFAP